jgi:hypothetical protein
MRVIDGSVPANTGLSFAYSLVHLFAILVIAYLFSAVMRSSVYSLILTFFAFFPSLPIVDTVGEIRQVQAVVFEIFASGIATDILKNPYPTHAMIATTAGRGLEVLAPGALISGAQHLPYGNGEPRRNGGVFHRRTVVGYRAYPAQRDVSVGTKKVQDFEKVWAMSSVSTWHLTAHEMTLRFQQRTVIEKSMGDLFFF